MAGAGGRTGGRSGQRSRLWLGLAVLIVGSFALGDSTHRIRAAADWLSSWWPWLLLALALLNLLRSAITPGSLIAPGLLAALALGGLAAAHGISARSLTDFVAPAALIVIGLALVLSSHEMESHRWTRVLATGRVRTADGLGSHTDTSQVVLRAIAGELRADLTDSFLDGNLTVQVTAVAGHVHLTVPRDWPVTVRTAGTVLTRVSDTGPRAGADADTVREVGLHLLGLAGAFSLVRT
ncbi:LiaF transmembrane domain-containing protein [Streptomyces sp. NPDC050528]|uniref:LiaF transmembrane domain-containing protein n=1 Tax=unclassified Streptomyces TaxID=2593676 RepID=UPI0037AF18CF